MLKRIKSFRNAWKSQVTLTNLKELSLLMLGSSVSLNFDQKSTANIFNLNDEKQRIKEFNSINQLHLQILTFSITCYTSTPLAKSTS